MVEFVKVKTGSNRTRSERAVMDKAFDTIRDLQLIETRSEHFLRVLEHGKISTNNYLRRFHNSFVGLFFLDFLFRLEPILNRMAFVAALLFI
jgi:hypothetical protein